MIKFITKYVSHRQNSQMIFTLFKRIILQYFYFILCATHRHIVLPPDDKSLESDGGMILTGKTEELGENPVPVPLCPPQIPHGLTRASAARGRRPTA
jgi:hypothetical protein